MSAPRRFAKYYANFHSMHGGSVILYGKFQCIVDVSMVIKVHAKFLNAYNMHFVMVVIVVHGLIMHMHACSILAG